MRDLDVDVLIGKTLTNIDVTDSERIVFTVDDGKQYIMEHYQDCCETVLVDDIEGSLDDLIGTPIIEAEEVTNCDDTFGRTLYGSWTWTFYKFATIKGYVTIKWLGESNGYYSESVTFSEVK